MDNVFIVVVSRALMMSNALYSSSILSVSYSEETAWTSIEKKINDIFTKNDFGYLQHISIHPELKFVRVIAPIGYGCDGTDMINAQYDYKIIRKKIID